MRQTGLRLDLLFDFPLPAVVVPNASIVCAQRVERHIEQPPVSEQGRREHDRLGPDADKWFVQAKEAPGSWWVPWSAWLEPFAGKMVAARAKLGSAKRKPLEPAPGRYVKERAEIEK